MTTDTDNGQRTSAPAEGTDGITICPVCGTPATAGSRICRLCFRSLRDQPPAGAEEAQAALAARRATARRRRLNRRLRLGVAALVGATLFGFWFVRPFLEGPPAPLPPASGTRTVRVQAATWPLPGGDLRGTRATAASAALDGEIAWTWEAGLETTTPLVASERALFVALIDGRLIALSVDDGTELWSVTVPGLLEAAPAVAGDRIYVGYRDGSVSALDAATGTTLWRAEGGRSVSATPLVVDGTVFVAANGRMLAFDAENGAELWRQEIDDTLVPVTPALEGDRLAVASYDRILFFDRTTGEQTSWFRFAPQQTPATSVALIGGTVVAVSQGLVAAFDVEMRRPWWDGVRGFWRAMNIMGAAPEPPWRPEIWATSSPWRAYPAVVDGGRIIVAGARGDVRAYSITNGAPLWSWSGPPVTAPPLLTAGGVLLAGPGMLTLVDAESGAELQRRDLPGVAPRDVVVTAHGTYLMTGAGRLLALR